MLFRGRGSDALFLNWVLPLASLPEPPGPLRYDVRRWEGGDAVFASAILFSQRELRWTALPLARVSYRQFQLHFAALEEDGTPALLVQTLLLSAWASPARLRAGQPARTAMFEFPSPALSENARWRVRRRRSLTVTTRPGPPQVGAGPPLGPWERMISYFCQRPVAYALGGRSLRRIEINFETPRSLPVRATLEDSSLLERCLPQVASPWPDLHSAWVCPELVGSLVLGPALRSAVGTQEVPIPG